MIFETLNIYKLFKNYDNINIIVNTIFLQWQTPPLGWRISRSSSTDELCYVNEYSGDEVSILSKLKFVCNATKSSPPKG